MGYAWGGSQAVAEQTAKYGWVTSRKRHWSSALSRSNPGSDHNTANSRAYAMDFATFNGAPLAYRIARHYGLSGYRTGNYANYYRRISGALFRFQVLWAVRGHFNHVHLGVRLNSGRYNPRPKPKPKPKSPYRFNTGAEKTHIYRLFYHRKGMRKEEKSGKGRKYYAHLGHARNHKKWLLDRANLLYKVGKKEGWRKNHRGARQKIIRAVVENGSRIK